MIVRRAVALDAPAVAAIMNNVIANTTATFTTVLKSQAQVISDISPPNPCLVLEIDGTVCGYARYFPFRSGPGYAHVAEYSIAPTDQAKGQGAGRALLERLCQLARDNGKSQMIGAISGNNLAALAFHTAMGFAKVGQLPGAGIKWGETLDLIIVQKHL
jgi:L-amino acid N-acyltransferase YncA